MTIHVKRKIHSRPFTLSNMQKKHPNEWNLTQKNAAFRYFFVPLHRQCIESERLERMRKNSAQQLETIISYSFLKRIRPVRLKDAESGDRFAVILHFNRNISVYFQIYSHLFII